MSYTIKVIIPGSGLDWYCWPVTDRVNWLLDNIGSDNFVITYPRLKSDEMHIEFKSVVDASAYKLKWADNGRNE